MTPQSMLKSPCNANCGLALETGTCPNCLRTLDEIIEWRAMTEVQRERVLAELPGRRPASAN